jgi:hypothetical protein
MKHLNVIASLATILLAWDWAGGSATVGHIWREGPKDKFSKIANVVLSEQKYTDTASDLKVGDEYCYKVCAGADQTDCSNVACTIAKDK